MSADRFPHDVREIAPDRLVAMAEAFLRLLEPVVMAEIKAEREAQK